MHAEQPREGGEAAIWLGWAAQGLFLLLAVFVFLSDTGRLATQLGLQDRGSWGAELADRPKDGFIQVLSVQPGRAAARAGIEVGDWVRADPAWALLRAPRTGESLPMTVDHAGQKRQVALSALPVDRSYNVGEKRLSVLYGVAMLNAVLFGIFIVWRSRGNLTTLLLGGALLCYGMIAVAPPVTPAAWFPGLLATGLVIFSLIPILFHGFALCFYRDHVGPLGRFTLGLFCVYALVQTGLAVHDIHAALTDFSLDLTLQTVSAFIGFAFCLGYLAVGWRRSAADVRQRYTLLLVATGAIVISQALDSTLGGGQVSSQSWVHILHLVANTVLTGVVACGLFAYSIFRHRVFDLGFAVNRTLVYGAVSVILLVGFGLVEWASDHFIPIEGREKNAIVDAAVALGVFLTFHRLRDAVEHVVERMFFQSWHEREAALRRFVAEAAYILKPKSLTRAFVLALSRFTDGAQAAVYLRAETGGFVLAEALGPDAPSEADADDPAVVALRARRTAVQAEDLASLGAFGLALPMMNRAEVMGFALVGRRTSGLAFRPDEIELLSWATQQIGLDLHALKIEQLEALAAGQRQELDRLHSRDVLRPAG